MFMHFCVVGCYPLDDQRWCDGGRDQQNTVANLLDSFTIELRWGLHLLALDHFPAGVNIQESLETWRREV